MRKIIAMQENPHVRMDWDVSKFPCWSNTSIATKKKLCERIQWDVTDTIIMGIK
jgi:hypothetical protein